MWKEVAVASALIFVGLESFSQEKKEPQAEEFKIPAEAAKRENPIKPTEGSVSEGKRLFSSQCALCHGKEGDAKGDLVEPMQLKLRDYRDPAALKEMTDGELFYILSKGKGKMPGEGDRMKADQRWHLINYIRSLARKEPAAKPAEAKPQDFR